MPDLQTRDEAQLAAPGRPDVEADLWQIYDVLISGGIAIFRSGHGYGVFGCTMDAVQRINTAKGRGAHKRQGILMNPAISEEVHIIDSKKREMIDCVVKDYNLPLGIVAGYRSDHPLLQQVEPDLLALCTAQGTVACALNSGGPFHEPLAGLSHKNNPPVFGSSANLTGTGQKYRVKDIQPEILAIADLVLDYGVPEHHLYGAAATLINFDRMEVVRFGVAYELISDVWRRHFNWELPPDPGRDANPSGHVDEFALTPTGLPVKDREDRTR